MRVPRTLALLLPALLAPPLLGQATMPRINVGPGQGPQADFREESWEYWWYMNQEPLIAARLEENRKSLGGGKGVFPPASSEDRASIAQALEKELGETDPGLRSALLMALARTGGREAGPALRRALRDDVLEVRRAAVLALGVLGDAAAVPDLADIVQDRKAEAEMRFTAAIALGLLPEPREAAAAVADGAAEAPLEEPAARAAPLLVDLGGAGAVALGFDPLGGGLAAFTGDGKVLAWRAGAVEPLLELGFRPTAAAWSPAGDAIAAGGEEGGVSIWSVRTGRVLATLPGEARVTSLCWDPERGERLAVGTADGVIRVFIARGEKLLMALSGHEDAVTTLSWQKGGERLASGSRDGTVRVWFTRSGTELARHEHRAGPIAAVAWRPDGALLALCGSDGALLLWDARKESAAGALAQAEGGAAGLQWSPDGVALAVACTDGTVRVLRFKAGAGIEARLLPGHEGGARALSWSPDGQALAALDGGGAVRVHDLAAAAPAEGAAAAGGGGAAAILAVFQELLRPQAFHSFESKVQCGIAIGAGLAGSPELSVPLRELLGRRKQPPAIARGYLVLALGMLGDTASRESLLEHFKDGDVHARRAAAIGLGALYARTGDPETQEAIAALDQEEGDLGVRLFAAVALGEVGGAAAASLGQTLDEPERGMVQGSGVLGPPRLTFGGYPRRAFAALGIGLAKDPGALDLLLERLAVERDHATRAAISLGLGLVGDTRAGKDVARALAEDKDPILRGYLALALGLMGWVEAKDAVRELLKGEIDIELVPNAALAGLLLQDREALDILLRRLTDERKPNARNAVLYGIGLFKDRGAIEPLAALLKNRSEPAHVRRYAAIALGEIADPRPLRAIGRLYAHFNYTAEPTLFHTLLSTL